MNKDWLKQILMGEKRLLKKSEVKHTEVGNYQEISVKGLYDEFTKRPDVKPYFPDKLAKGK